MIQPSRGLSGHRLCAHLTVKPYAGVGCVSSTAAKYSSGATLRRYVGSPGASLTCSAPVGDILARGSGRRGRRFKSCHPDCIPAGHPCRSGAVSRPECSLRCQFGTQCYICCDANLLHHATPLSGWAPGGTRADMGVAACRLRGTSPSPLGRPPRPVRPFGARTRMTDPLRAQSGSPA